MLTRRRLLVHGTSVLIFTPLMAPVVVGCTNVTNIMVGPPDAPPEPVPDAAPTCLGGFLSTSSIDDGHSHTLCVPIGDIETPPAAGATYTSSDTVGHVHTVSLTPGQLATLATGGTVAVTSSLAVDPVDTVNHAHVWMLTRL